MVYINRDGTVLKERPWSFNRIFEVFVLFFVAVVAFFRTLLFPILPSGDDSRGSRGWGSSSGGGGGGPGGGGGGSGGGGPSMGSFGTNRRIGRIQQPPQCNIPGGGCCGQ